MAVFQEGGHYAPQEFIHNDKKRGKGRERAGARSVPGIEALGESLEKELELETGEEMRRQYREAIESLEREIVEKAGTEKGGDLWEERDRLVTLLKGMERGERSPIELELREEAEKDPGLKIQIKKIDGARDGLLAKVQRGIGSLFGRLKNAREIVSKAGPMPKIPGIEYIGSLADELDQEAEKRRGEKSTEKEVEAVGKKEILVKEIEDLEGAIGNSTKRLKDLGERVRRIREILAKEGYSSEKNREKLTLAKEQGKEAEKLKLLEEALGRKKAELKTETRPYLQLKVEKERAARLEKSGRTEGGLYEKVQKKIKRLEDAVGQGLEQSEAEARRQREEAEENPLILELKEYEKKATKMEQAGKVSSNLYKKVQDRLEKLRDAISQGKEKLEPAPTKAERNLEKSEDVVEVTPSKEIEEEPSVVVDPELLKEGARVANEEKIAALKRKIMSARGDKTRGEEIEEREEVKKAKRVLAELATRPQRNIEIAKEELGKLAARYKKETGESGVYRIALEERIEGAARAVEELKKGGEVIREEKERITREDDKYWPEKRGRLQAEEKSLADQQWSKRQELKYLKMKQMMLDQAPKIDASHKKYLEIENYAKENNGTLPPGEFLENYLDFSARDYEKAYEAFYSLEYKKESIERKLHDLEERKSGLGFFSSERRQVAQEIKNLRRERAGLEKSGRSVSEKWGEMVDTIYEHFGDKSKRRTIVGGKSFRLSKRFR